MLSNGGVDLTVAASATSFTFPGAFTTGTAYAVTVKTAPTGRTCTVASGAGTFASANVANVVVTCSLQSFNVKGTISGLTSAGLVLANGSDTLTVAANATSFTMPAVVAFGSSYNVTVQTQPANASCAVTSGSGTMPAADVVNVTVTCTGNPFTLGGTITGLGAAAGLVLTNNAGSNNLTVNPNATAFTLSGTVAFGTGYAVTVQTQPAGLFCSVANGVGTVPASNTTNVAVTCNAQSYSIGGSVTGATTAGLTLKLNGGSSLVVAANATTYTFTSNIAGGGTYAVTVGTQPAGRFCSVSNGAGTAAANVINANVICAASSVTLGGTISSLTSTGLVLANSSDTVSPAANATQFTFTNGLALGSTYGVSVQTQPTSLNCTLGNATGTANANVTNVTVGCVAVAAGPQAWTWVGGPQNLDSPGTYGTQGTGSTNNNPGARYQASAWKDTTGNFWLYSGYGTDGVSNYGRLSDIWKYNPTNSQWTWVSGVNTRNQFPNWGTKGVANANNTPGGRQASLSWRDASGNLYTFGGSTLSDGPGGQNGENVLCQDVWKFDIATNQWTWLNGPSTCVVDSVSGITNVNYTWERTSGNAATFGTLGTPAANNIPTGRINSATWVDAAGNFWLFGGIGYDTSGNVQFLSDLWRYNPSTNQWTWMGGPQATNQPGTYGTLGTGSVNNIPGARQQMVSWADSQGNFWLFGGQPSTGGRLNDLWKYNIASGQWTWVSGSNTANSTGTYGTPRVQAANNAPPARMGSVGWIDAAGTLWMYGGIDNSNGYFNDLWAFQPSIGQWMWYQGYNVTNANGVYGTLGVANANNNPGARVQGATWIDGTNRLWMFGGSGKDGLGGVNPGNLNDLWKY